MLSGRMREEGRQHPSGQGAATNSLKMTNGRKLEWSDTQEVDGQKLTTGMNLRMQDVNSDIIPSFVLPLYPEKDISLLLTAAPCVLLLLNELHTIPLMCCSGGASDAAANGGTLSVEPR